MQHRPQSVLQSFEDQITVEKSQLEAQAAGLPPGPQQDALLEKIRQLETASHMNEWLTPPDYSHRPKR
jgi:hypothetical protein